MMNKVQAKPLVLTKQLFIKEEGHCRLAQWQFNALFQSEISKMAATQMFLGRYYDSNQKPLKCSLLEACLGPVHWQYGDCETCGAKISDCPSHFGYLVLAVPVFNLGYLSTVVDVLKCLCKSRSQIILDDKLHSCFLNIVKDPKCKSMMMDLIVKKWTSMASIYGSMKCPKCGNIFGSLRRAQGMPGILHSAVDDFKSVIPVTMDSRASINLQPHMLNPVTVLSLFGKMLDEDCKLLNLKSTAENPIMTTIAVPVGGSESNENDITERLKRVSQANVQLDLSEDSTIRFLSNWDTLQDEVAQYINSDVRGVSYQMQPNTKPLNGLVQRLKGKSGHFCGNLCGKCVEYTGRTVVSPDPNLKVTGVGMQMAQILSHPEGLSHHNIDKLRQCVVNGPDKYPGSQMLKCPNGSEWSLRANRNLHADDLKYGDIVDRHLEYGDIFPVNRQPSLHLMSIICHRARIMPRRTLRSNESVCNSYYADFDGVKMNMHAPQTEEPQTEAAMLMGVQNNLCTPKNREILVASSEDFLTSSFLITRKDTFYDSAYFSFLCSYTGDGTDPVDLPTPAVIKPIELWTGKQLYSLLVCPNSNARVNQNLTVTEKSYSDTKTKDGRETDAVCPNNGSIYFRNSELLSGQLGKGTLGVRDYKACAAASCMNHLAKLSARWIGNHGFSIGISNVQRSDILYGVQGKITKNGCDKCDDQTKLYNEGQLGLTPGCDAAQSLEYGISALLNDIGDQTGKVIQISGPEALYSDHVLKDLFDSSGTTNIAFGNRECIYVAVDSRRTRDADNEIADNEHYKFLDLGDIVPNIVGTQCGNAGVCKLIPKMIREMVDETGHMSIQDVAECVFNFLKMEAENENATARRRERFRRTSTILSTVDSEGPVMFIVNCQNHGPIRIESDQFACCGSGSKYARSVLECRNSLLGWYCFR